MNKRKEARFIPFSYRLFVSYLLLVMTPLIVLGFYSYYSSVQSVKKLTESNIQVALQQMNNSIDMKLEDVKRSSDQLYGDQVLSGVLSGYVLDFERFSVMSNSIIPKVNQALSLPISTTQISLYLENNSLSEIHFDNNGDPLLKGRSFEILHKTRIDHASWYQSLSLDYDSLIWKQVDKDEEYHNVSLIRPLIDYERFKPIGVIKSTVKLGDLLQSVNYEMLGPEDHLFILDDKSRPMYISSAHATEEEIPALLADNKTYLSINKDIPKLNARLVALIPLNEVKRNSNQLRSLTILICVASLLVLSLISLIISKLFTKRITKLLTSIDAFREGEFHKRIVYSGNDEFTLIASAFNNMTSTVEHLIEEVYTSRLQKKEAELQILHSQINPHFLYNTISSVSRMAKLGELEKLQEMLRGMAKYYRLTLNMGEMIISIEKELQQIQVYLEIQRIKYAERIKVEYDFQPELLQYDTVKFIFQPFVENVLEHAWYDDEIHIRISGQLENNTLSFEITDNGLGISPDILEHLFDENARIGYGIRNVDDRIKLHYGTQYGVTLSSVLGEGTTVRITIPVKDRKSRPEPNQPPSRRP